MSGLREAPRERSGPDALLEVRGLSKRYGPRWALSDVGFTVRPGEVLGLVGPNGAGKTTLFQALAGLVPVEGGRLSFRGEGLPPARAREALFYVPDGILPWPERRVGWLLDFFQAIHGASAQARAEAESALALGALGRARLGTLSKGERKRVLIAAGLLTPQPLWLMDEPFDGLDLRQMREVMALLRARAGQGRALFFSLHHLAEAVRVCDRLVLLSGGRVVGEGTREELAVRAGKPGAELEEIFLALT